MLKIHCKSLLKKSSGIFFPLTLTLSLSAFIECLHTPSQIATYHWINKFFKELLNYLDEEKKILFIYRRKKYYKFNFNGFSKLQELSIDNFTDN